MFFVFERSFNNGGYMIIEIEYYKYHTKLIGGDICSSDLNRLLMQAEKLYDRESDNFERVLCSLMLAVSSYSAPDSLLRRMRDQIMFMIEI